MAITHISSAHGAGSGFNGGTTSTATLPGTIAADDLLIVAVACTDGGTPISTPTDNKGGNTYTPAAAEMGPSNVTVSRVWYCKVVNGGTSFQVTATIAGAGSGDLIVHQIRGQDLSAPLDKVVNNYQASPGTGTDAITSTAQTPTSAGQYIFGFMAEADFVDAVTFTAGTGFTTGETSGNSNFVQRSEYLIQGAASSVAATFTENVAVGTATWLVTFKAAAAGSSSVSPSVSPSSSVSASSSRSPSPSSSLSPSASQSPSSSVSPSPPPLLVIQRTVLDYID